MTVLQLRPIHGYITSAAAPRSMTAHYNTQTDGRTANADVVRFSLLAAADAEHVSHPPLPLTAVGDDFRVLTTPLPQTTTEILNYQIKIYFDTNRLT